MMKKEMKSLTREQMKKVKGGTNFTLWDCMMAGYGVLQCASANPTGTCDYTSCTDTGVRCNWTGCA